MLNDRLGGTRRTTALVAGILGLASLTVRWAGFADPTAGWGLALWVVQGIAILTVLICCVAPRRGPRRLPADD